MTCLGTEISLLESFPLCSFSGYILRRCMRGSKSRVRGSALCAHRAYLPAFVDVLLQLRLVETSNFQRSFQMGCCKEVLMYRLLALDRKKE